MARRHEGPYIKRRGNSFVLYTYRGDKRVRRSLGRVSEDEARQACAVARLEWELGRELTLPELHQAFGFQGGEFKAFIGKYLDWRKSAFPSSQTRVAQLIRQHLMPYFGEAELEAISTADVREYIQRRQQADASDATIKKELDTLGAILRCAHEWGDLKELSVHPGRLIKIRERRSVGFYTVEELEQLYQWSPYHGPAWIWMVNTGMRRAEAQKARRRDIRQNRVHIEWTDDGRTKSGTWRVVPLNTSSEGILPHLGKDYLLERTTPQALTRAFKKCAQRADLPGSLHWLRHTFCSHLVMAGVPLRAVQQLAGHENMRTTERYAHLAPDHLADSVGRISL